MNATVSMNAYRTPSDLMACVERHLGCIRSGHGYALPLWLAERIEDEIDVVVEDWLLDRRASMRAAVDAGYASLRNYVAEYGNSATTQREGSSPAAA